MESTQMIFEKGCFTHVHSIKVNMLTFIIDNIVKFIMVQPGHKLQRKYHLVILFNPSSYPGIVMCYSSKRGPKGLRPTGTGSTNVPFWNAL